jgi:hypothetical protein
LDYTHNYHFGGYIMILAVEDSMLSDTDACDGLKHDNWHPFVVSPPFLLLSCLPSSGRPTPVLFPSHPRLLTFGLCVCFAIGPLGKQSFKSWLRLNICDGIILDK